MPLDRAANLQIRKWTLRRFRHFDFRQLGLRHCYVAPTFSQQLLRPLAHCRQISDFYVGVHAGLLGLSVS
jgi:hypothetical protein